MKEQYEMFELVTNELKQAPVVIDSEDLVTHPGILSRTCQASRLSQCTDSYQFSLTEK